MGSLSDYAENKMVDHGLGTAYTSVATIYLALCTADPTDAGTGASMNEVANSGSYTRKAISFGAAASRRVTQSATVTFDRATGSWGTVTHWALVDSATYGAGNMLAHGSVTISKTVVSGNTPSVASGQIYVEVTAGYVGDYFANGFLDRMFRNQTLTIATPVYIALTTATIADANTGSTITEPSGNAYARVAVNAASGASPAWGAASGGAATNAHDITFITATGSWGTLVAAAVVSAASGGNLIFYDNGVADQAVTTDDTVYFPAGDFDVSMS